MTDDITALVERLRALTSGSAQWHELFGACHDAATTLTAAQARIATLEGAVADWRTRAEEFRGKVAPLVHAEQRERNTARELAAAQARIGELESLRGVVKDICSALATAEGRLAEVERERDVARAALREAWLQITYLHDKFGATGTGNAVLAQIDAALSDHQTGLTMLVDREWLQRKIETDPDLPCEAGVPLSDHQTEDRHD